MNKKFIAAVVAALIFGVMSTTFAAKSSFSDVPRNHWAYKDVMMLAKEGIVTSSYTDGTFHGSEKISRYETAVMLANLINKIAPQDEFIAGAKIKFNDVPANHWAYKSLLILAENDIVKPYQDGTFRGTKYITRYEMSVMIANLFNKNDKGQQFTIADAFSDVPENHWAYNAVTMLSAMKINGGYGDGTFRGNNNVTRYETAIILAKIYNKLFN